MTGYRFARVPQDGERIDFSNGKLNVPDVPIIPFIEGDGTGPDIWRASKRVFDAAVQRAFSGARRIAWMEVFAGEKAFTNYGDWLPQETVDALQEFRVSIKGPLSTPVGGGIRSLNVTLRQVLDLYACIRPVRYFEGVGNMMKFTEGAFRDWGYEVAREKFAECCVTESDLAKGGSAARADAIIVKDRIADAMFQQLLLRPEEYSVIATSNLNGDYLSDAAAAQVGGLGMAPGGNVGDGLACFEATHGTAPKYAGQDKVNPCSVILSGVMMLEYLEWDAAASLIVRGIERAIKSGRVTYDLARQMPGSTEVSTSAFADGIIAGMM